MATKAATFKAKIRSLEDYVDRVTRSVTPLPTGADICNTLKYFSMTLLGVLKDVPVPPPDQRERAKRDADRLAAFPNLNYADFYTALHRTMEAVALVQQGQVTLGQAVLHNLGCLVPFLTHDLRESLPYTVASLLATFPNALLSEIIDLLCSNLLPVILGGADPNDVETYVSASVPAIIMMVFQYVSNPGFHSQVVECIMGLKRNVFKDLLIVIAHGTHAARLPAANLLFHYWPSLNPSLFDKRGIHYKYMGWRPNLCQRDKCSSIEEKNAVKMCVDAGLAKESSEKPPPVYLCAACSQELIQKQCGPYLKDVVLPMETVALHCEDKVRQ